MWNISLAIAFSTSGWPCMQRSEVFIASSEQPFSGSLHPAQLHSKSSSKNAQTFQSIQRAASCVQHQPAKAQACLPINISNPLTTTRLETQWADCGINNLTVSEEDTCVLKPTAALRLAPLSYQSSIHQPPSNGHAHQLTQGPGPDGELGHVTMKNENVSTSKEIQSA